MRSASANPSGPRFRNSATSSGPGFFPSSEPVASAVAQRTVPIAKATAKIHTALAMIWASFYSVKDSHPCDRFYGRNSPNLRNEYVTTAPSNPSSRGRGQGVRVFFLATYEGPGTMKKDEKLHQLRPPN